MGSTLRKLTLLVALGALAGTTGGSYAAFSNSTSSAGNTFSAAASFASCTSTNPTWVTGMEHGVVSTAGGGLFDYQQLASADSAVKRTGGYSLRLDSIAGTAAYAGKLMGGSDMVLRFALRFPTLPTADVALLASTYVSAGNNLQLGYRASDQKLTLSFGGTNLVASNSPITAGNWHVIDMRASLGANPRTGDWRINGSAQPSTSSAEAAAGNFLVLLGSFVAADVYTAHYDDILASGTGGDYPLGDGRVRALSPNAVDTHNNPANFEDDTGGAIGATSWNRLDEIPMSSTGDSVRQRTASGASYLGFGFANPAQTCVRAVSAVLAYRSASGASNSAKTSIFDGGVERTVFSGDMGGNSLMYKSTVVAPDISPWTKGAVDNLIARVGYATDANPNPYWESLLLEYETPD
jgi:hypothetical protein